MAKVGGPRVFFDIVGIFNATSMIKDMDAKMTVVEAIVLDSMDAIVGSFAGISETITAITDATIPLAQSLSEATIEFEKFAGVNKELAAGIIETGMGFGFTAEESLSAGAKMAQLTALIGESSVEAATEMGQTFALISGMGTTEAMTRMINLQQQTSFMYGDLTKKQFDMMNADMKANIVRENTIDILNQLNTVENRSASTMKQITFVMNQFAAQAHQTGEEIRHMAAMSAVLIESGEEQGKAGRALRMIYARLGADTSGAQQAIQELGIATHDANTGALRPLSAIVEDLAPKFKDLAAEERQRIVQTVAGNDHYVRFIKLIENQARMSELATDAIFNQSTATEELNRVISDQSTKLKEAQAELQHNEALLGQALVPAYTRATEVQAQFTLGLAQLSETGIGNTFATGIIILQRYGQILGGVFDTYLNIKSVNIAMKTHMAILRAINGEELVRTDTHRQRNTLSTATISLDEKIALIQHRILEAKLAIQNVELLGYADARQQHKIRLEQQLAFEIESTKRLIEERNMLYLTGAQIRQQTATIGENAYMSELNGHERIKHSIMAKGAAQVELTEAQILGMQKTNALLEQEAIVLAQGVHALKVKTALDMKNSKEYIVRARAKIAMLQDDLKFERVADRESLMRKPAIIKEIERLNLQIERRVEANKKAMVSVRNLNAIDEKIILQNAHMINQNEHLVDLHLILGNAIESEAARKSRISAIDDELIATMMAQGFLKEDLALLTGVEINQLTILSEKKGLVAQATLEENVAMMQQAVERRKALMGMSDTIPLMNNMSMGMTKLSMAAGMASMSVHMLAGVFGIDDEKSMRVSMILMTMSMIPAMAQMAMMTTSMTQLGLATQKTTTQLKGFKLALAATGVGLALILGAFAIDHFISDTNDELEELNTTLTTTADLLGKITKVEASEFAVPTELQNSLGLIVDLTTATKDELNGMGALATAEIMRIDESMKYLATDDPMLQYFADRKAAIIGFGEAVGQQTSINMFAKYDDQDAMDEEELIRMVLGDIHAGSLAEGVELPIFMTYKTRRGNSSSDTYGVMNNQTVTKEVTDAGSALRRLNAGTSDFNDLTKEGREFLLDVANSAQYMGENFGYATDNMSDGMEDVGDGFTEAEEKMRAFANAREELFFGGRSQYMTGEMMKQVVNKGVENLYSNVELLMTNNFYGLTFDEAVNEISSRITDQLISQGVPLSAR